MKHLQLAGEETVAVDLADPDFDLLGILLRSAVLHGLSDIASLIALIIL